MIGQVKTINGVKTVVPLSNEVATDSVSSGNMESVTSNAIAMNCQGFITTSYTELSFASGSTQLPYTIPENGYLVIGYSLWCNLGSRTILEMGSNTMGGIPLKKGTNVVIFRPNTSTNSTVRFYPYSYS